MISEERLEELIKQGATIYELHNKNIIWAIELKNDWYIMGDTLYEQKLSKYPFLSYQISNLYENKEQAEFYKNYKNIKSTHILDLPTWEELQKTACFYFKDYYGEDCIMRDDVDEITVEGTIDNEPYRRELATWTFPRTEDGYLSACEICKKLFLGEIDD